MPGLIQEIRRTHNFSAARNVAEETQSSANPTASKSGIGPISSTGDVLTDKQAWVPGSASASEEGQIALVCANSRLSEVRIIKNGCKGRKSQFVIGSRALPCDLNSYLFLFSPLASLFPPPSFPSATTAKLFDA